MLKILKIKISGYKLLDDNFEIDLTTKARVINEDLEKEIIQIDDGLYTFSTLSFVGANSSGKSTVLSLILKTALFLKEGRWPYSFNEYKGDKIDFSVIFYLDGYLYSYSSIFLKIEDNLPSNFLFSKIADEKLYKMKYNKSLGKRKLDFIGNSYIEITKDLASLNDTSAITKLTADNIIVDWFNENNIISFEQVLVRNSFFTCLKSLDIRFVSSIIQLLDEDIEYMIYKDKDYVLFKRFNEPEIPVPSRDLLTYLSSGTIRGVELYVKAILALLYGKIFIVDEIENSFQKNLVYNLLFLFNDSELNKNGAQLIFSTHYVEILDYLKRRDSTYIMHKNNGRIVTNNLYKDYDVRTELLKSKQFDNNVFNTILNYDQLMEVRRKLINELQSDNDRRN